MSVPAIHSSEARPELRFRSAIAQLAAGHRWAQLTPQLGPALLVAAAYYAGSQFGFALTLPPRPVSVLWPPNSILLAGLLSTGPRHWWIIFLAVLPAHLAVQIGSGVPLAMSLCWFTSNSFEAIVGACCTGYLIKSQLRFDIVRHVAAFCLCGAIAGPLLASFLDAGFVRLNQWGSTGFWENWEVRSASNILAALTVTPAIINYRALFSGRVSHSLLSRKVEACVLFTGLLLASFYVYDVYRAGLSGNVALLYVGVPFLLWGALRFGALGASTAMLITTLLAIWGAAHGRGPFSTRSPAENAQAMQLFLTLASMAMLMLGATVEERSRAEERFVKAFRLCPDAMLICRWSDGLVIDSNKRWQELFGFGFTGEKRTLLELEIYASSFDQHRLRSSISKEGPFRDLELNLLSSNGEVLHTLASADRAEINGESCCIFVLRDMTDRKRAQEAYENLAHVSRLALVGELTGMIAHEINQPLGATLSEVGTADLLLKGGSANLDEIRTILDEIRKNSLRAGEVIRRTRALLKRTEVQLRPLDVNEAASEVMKFIGPDAVRKHVHIRSELDLAVPVVSGDRVYLQQVLLNLFVNGIESMLGTPVSSRILTVRTSKSDGQVELQVQDTGPGILSENLPHLFASFFTTKKEGLGLGLAISRSIIEAHQGRIWAENASEGGALFRIRLPAMKGPPS
jgi:PAS domain S-box-containing protein